ncbi:MAG: hypothetical protein H8E39_08765 [Alphaproteobacteria bacterium]|nr:hypothetical protein [Alphaproteobacteria bacterium]
MHRQHLNPFDRFGRTWRIEQTSSLVTLFICSALTLILYLSTSAIGFGSFSDKWSYRPRDEAAQPFRETLPPFGFSGIRLGMTPIETGSVHPSISMSGAPEGRQIGRFKLGNGTYTVSFMGPEAGRKSYRLHFTETYWNVSEIEIRERLKRKFGAPDINRCGMENASQGWVCRLRWQRTDNVVLEALTRTSLSTHGARSTDLEFTALDRQTLAYRKKPALTRMKAISSAIKGAALGM